MNIEKLKELSTERLKKIGVNNESYFEALQVQKLKRRIFELRKEIRELRENAIYEKDNFSAIDKREITIEELEKRLSKLSKTYETPDFCNRSFDVNFTQFNEFLVLTGIIGLLLDPNYTEVLKNNADEIGLPSLKDDDVLRQLHTSGLPLNDIDFRILTVKDMDFEYDTEEVTNAVTNYIERLFDIMSVIPLDKYFDLNDIFLSNEDVYVPECCETMYGDGNLYDQMLLCYDKEICKELLKSFVYDELYEVVNPGYSMLIMNVKKKMLLKEENGKTTLEDPRKIYAYYIKKHNLEELKDAEEELDYEPVILNGFSDFTYLRDDRKSFSCLEDFNLSRSMVWEIDRWNVSEINVSEEEIEKFENAKVKKKVN